MVSEALRAALAKAARDFGTPCYVYLMDEVRERVDQTRSAFGGRFRISYAVKSNPNPGLLRRLGGVVDLLDVSSAGEIVRAVGCGWAADALSFTGPGKTRRELETAVDAGIGEVVVESVDEAELLNAVAQAAGRQQRILVRIAPQRMPRGFGVSMSGKPTQFGIDEEEIDSAIDTIRRLANLDLVGLHIYSGTQCLKPEAIVDNYQIFIDIFGRVCNAHGVSPQRLVFGSGIGIPYHEGDQPVDLAAVAEMINPRLDTLKSGRLFSKTDLVLETGRYLVGEAGFYVTRVVRRKQSRGVEIGICDGGMNHHLGAAGHLGSVVQRNYRMFKLGVGRDQEAERTYTLVGPLCTTIDTLARQVKLRGLEAGDLIAIHCSGAYGVTASPIHFISHRPPKEIIAETAGGSSASKTAASSLRPGETASGREGTCDRATRRSDHSRYPEVRDDAAAKIGGRASQYCLSRRDQRVHGLRPLPEQ